MATKDGTIEQHFTLAPRGEVSLRSHAGEITVRGWSGPTVRVRLLSVSPGRSDIGVERTFSDVTMELVDGHIISWRSMSDSADAETAWWLDHRSTPRPIPIPTTATTPS